MDPPDLPATVRVRLINAALDKMPGPPVDRHAIFAIHGLGPVLSQEIDARWRDLYRADILVAVLDFVGLNCALLADDPGKTTTAAADGFSESATSETLGELARRAETRFDAVLRLELERFKKEVEDAGSTGRTTEKKTNNTPPGTDDLQTPANLALLWALFIAAAFVDIRMSRMDVGYTYLGLIASVFRSAGFSDPTSADNLDDFHFRSLWNNIFWIATAFDFWVSFQTRRESHLDPSANKELAKAPMSVPPEWLLALIPHPSKRAIAAPIPPKLLNGPRITAREFFGWADPLSEMEDKGEARALTLGFCVAGMKTNGTLQLASFLAYLALKISDFVRWLKEEAGLTMLELAVATEVLGSGQDEQPQIQTSNNHELLEPDFTNSIHLKSPHLQEAVRRRSFLLDALEAIIHALPLDVAEAIAAHDLTALQTALPRSPPTVTLMLMSNMAHVREMVMQLSSPELFSNFARYDDDDDNDDLIPIPDASLQAKDSQSSLTSSNATLTDNFEASLDLWFTSQAFQSASTNAVAISGLVRTLMATVAPAALQVFSVVLCYSATHAAWLHLLVLQRFRSLVAHATGSDLGKAEKLYNDVRDDVQVCIDYLKIAGSESHQPARLLLEELFEEGDTKLARADMEMLRLSRQVARRCRMVVTRGLVATAGSAQRRSAREEGSKRTRWWRI